MRKTIFAFASVLIILVSFGCNKDKDDNKVSIVGTWTLQSQTTKSYVGTSTDPTDTDNYDPSTDGVSTVTFNADGTLTSVSDGETDNGTYTYDANNKKLTLTQDIITLPYTVTTLTSSNLVLHGEYSYPVDNVTYKTVIDASLKR